MTPQEPERKTLAAVYDTYAGVRKEAGKESWKVTEREMFLAVMKREGARGLLEIGGGVGEDAKFFQNNGLHVVVIDLSPKHVGMMKTIGLEAEVRDFYELNFPDNKFDAVYLMNALVHVPKKDLEMILEKINKVVKAGGLIYLGEYGGEDFEGIRENDKYKPNRFFCFYLFEDFKTILMKHFLVERAEKIDFGVSIEFHSFVLRKR